MAAQGGASESAALYVGTAAFDAVLGGFISGLLIPMLYIYLCLAIAQSVLGEDQIKRLRDFVKWLMVWGLKIILYVFTGYMGITGAVSGSADAAAVKAAKLTISGMVPVVGGILSDASQSVLVGAGVMRATAGVYGALVLLAICAEPFLRIGIQYLMLKATGAVCGLFGSGKLSAVIADFSTAMGLLLGMTGSMCLLLLISIVCLMKGVG
jgi:stage III sporulation protein AE